MFEDKKRKDTSGKKDEAHSGVGTKKNMSLHDEDESVTAPHTPHGTSRPKNILPARLMPAETKEEAIGEFTPMAESAKSMVGELGVKIAELLEKKPSLGCDEIVSITEADVAEVLTALTMLETIGLCTQEAGGNYKRT